jgi:hypothetical protein
MLPDTDKPLTLAGRHGGRRRRPGAVVYAMFCKPMRERERAYGLLLRTKQSDQCKGQSDVQKV